MNLHYCWLLLTLLIAFTGATETLEEDGYTMASHFYFTPVQGRDFDLPVADKSQWQKRNFPGIPLADKNLWIQVEFDFANDKQFPQTLFVAALGSYKAWWDGELLGQNGVPGATAESETPGQIESRLRIPRMHTGRGKHTLSLYFSAHHNAPEQGYGMFWAYLINANIAAQSSINQNFLPLLMSGALLFLSCYCLIHFCITDKQLSYLVFGLLSLALVALFVTESWRSLWGYTYDWHIPRLQAVLLLTFLIAGLLVAFFVELFRFSGKESLLWLSVMLAVQGYFFASFDGYDTTSLQIFLVSVSLSLLICIRAWASGKSHARSMFFGVLLFLAPVIINTHFYMEQYFFVSFGALAVLMMFILSKSIQSQKRELLQSQLTASRLQLELVKRNIQPHFILNTLTAVEEWIEQSPHTAIQFVQALAEEFRALAQSSSEKLISLSQEIAHCRAHLKVMEYRAESQFTLHAELPETPLFLPPGILLTLLENALSHNRYGDEHIVFLCDINTEKDKVRMTFTSPISNPGRDKTLKTGLGHQYLTARLKESFNQDWHYSEQQQNQHWVCQIIFPLVSAQQGKQ